jgi:DNA-binding transcriptional ArsR family regulator
VNTLAALSDPTRRRIIEMLATGPLSSGDIASEFDITAPAVSQHLKTLRAAKLVRVRVDAQRRIYELDGEGIDELSEWLLKIRSFWAGKLDDLEKRLKERT